MSTKKDFQEHDVKKLLKALYGVLAFLVALELLPTGYTGLLILRGPPCDVYQSVTHRWIQIASFTIWVAAFVLSLVCLAIECWVKRLKGILLTAGGIVLWWGLLWLLLSFLVYCWWRPVTP